jgi:L-fuconolactonase
MTKSKIIDSHHHLWQLSRGDYKWLTPDLTKLYRDFDTVDYLQVSQSSPVAESILVQAADTDAETDFLLQQADDNDFIVGVVGWIDMEASIEQSCQRLNSLAVNFKFKGIRPMLQDIDDIDWILNSAFAPVFECLINLNLTFDALIKTEHLTNIYLLATQYPELNIVIDHCAKPDIANQEFDTWASALEMFENCRNVYIKVSGLPTEASINQNDVSYFEKYFDHVYQVFGADRMMWGSDWPVVNLNSNYLDWFSKSKQLIMNLSSQDQQAIWSGTATKFYRL